jgi:S1-C subfamily serine protease
MGKLLSFFLVTILASCASSGPDYRALAAKVVPSNVELIGDFTNPWTGEVIKDRVYCSGFAIDPVTVVTAGHCVAVPQSELQITQFDGKIKIRTYSGKVGLAAILVSTFIEKQEGDGKDSRDTAVLLVEGLDLVPAALGDSDTIQQGQLVAVVGNTLGELVYTFNVTMVTHAKRFFPEGEFFQVGPGSAGGNSGGPVFNMQGEVIGMLTRGADGVAGLVVPLKRVFAEWDDAVQQKK